jgi:hypothetical protein
MAILTNNSTETTRNSRKQQYCLEWRNIKTIISQTADKSLGKYKAFTQNKKLKILADAIKLTVQQKKLAYKKYLHTKKINKDTEYKSRRANAKREIIKRHHKSWEQFTSHLEPDIYKIKPNTFKLLNHMNKYIKESAHGRIGRAVYKITGTIKCMGDCGLHYHLLEKNLGT